jgi:hypothetical protein
MKIFLYILFLCSVFSSYVLGVEIRMGTREFSDVLRYGAVAKYSLRIVDDDGVAVSNALVKVSFAMEDSQWITGLSDTNGIFSASGKSRGEMLYCVHKDGYYQTKQRITFGRHDGVVVRDGKWQPWNPQIAVVLRRILNPIPMYVKAVETHIPSGADSIGYDLVVGDWVDPHGIGKINDFIFRILTRRVKSWSDFDGSLSVTFDAARDGVSLRHDAGDGGSDFAWDYRAPEGEYNRSLQIDIGYVPSKGLYKSNESAACYFRVRSETNEYGEIKSAYYGKMPSPIQFDVRDTDTGWIKFTYYLNPTPNDRNMEFDPKQNLFKNLGSLEQVNKP